MNKHKIQYIVSSNLMDTNLIIYQIVTTSE